MQATAVILAAGLGTRMKSAIPKPLHPLAGRPMLKHLLDSCAQVFSRVVVVLGPEMDMVSAAAAPHAVVVQHERLGTAHAALQAAEMFGPGDVAVLYADNPLITADTLHRLLRRRAEGDVGLALLAMRPADPAHYGRLIGDGQYVERIVEWADAGAEERVVGLCNAGVLCADAAQMRRWLNAVGRHNAKGEFYLTDVVALARADGALVAAVEAPESETLGVNSRAELALAEAEVQRRLRLAAMDAGATLTDPATVYFSYDTKLGCDVTVGPNVVFGPGVEVESGAVIHPFCHLINCTVRAGASIGPFARLRPGAVVGRGAHVGNFVELKATVLGDGAKANHLTYLGDTDVGAGSNVGAGTITCNYDGFAKHHTSIGAGSFVGSHTTLVAPVSLGPGSFTAAGSVITHDVPADAMAFGRAEQIDKPGRAAAFRAARGKYGSKT